MVAFDAPVHEAELCRLQMCYLDIKVMDVSDDLWKSVKLRIVPLQCSSHVS